MNELQERFARALAPEPPFETDLGAALDAAVRGGRRRRARAIAGRTLVVAACAVIVGGVALAIRPPGSPAPGTAPLVGTASSSAPSRPPDQVACGPTPGASQPGPAPGVLPSPATPTGPVPPAGSCPFDLLPNGRPAKPADLPAAVLTSVAKAVAASVASSSGAGTARTGPAGVVTVRTGAGTYSVAVAVWADRFDAQAWAGGCLSGDGKPCRVLDRTGTDVAMATRYLDGSGRAKLVYVADAGVTGDTPLTVEVTVDNVVERVGAPKSIGPTWSQLGFTPAGIRAAIARTSPLA